MVLLDTVTQYTVWFFTAQTPATPSTIAVTAIPKNTPSTELQQPINTLPVSFQKPQSFYRERDMNLLNNAKPWEFNY